MVGGVVTVGGNAGVWEDELVVTELRIEHPLIAIYKKGERAS